MSTPDTTDQDLLGLRPLKEITLGERVIDPDQIPWVPYTETIWVKPLRLNRKTGLWANLTKVDGGGQINRHYHVNGVIGFVLEGSWYYAETDWVARPGMMVWEPPGDVHTLMSGDEGHDHAVPARGRAALRRRGATTWSASTTSSTTRRPTTTSAAPQGIEPLDLDY